MRAGSQTVTITDVSSSSPLTNVHHPLRGHRVTRIPFGAYPLLLEAGPA